jgi:hypothetical protein
MCVWGSYDGLAEGATYFLTCEREKSELEWSNLFFDTGPFPHPFIGRQLERGRKPVGRLVFYAPRRTRPRREDSERCQRRTRERATAPGGAHSREAGARGRATRRRVTADSFIELATRARPARRGTAAAVGAAATAPARKNKTQHSVAAPRPEARPYLKYRGDARRPPRGAAAGAFGSRPPRRLAAVLTARPAPFRASRRSRACSGPARPAAPRRRARR